jgi:hypothetical protein
MELFKVRVQDLGRIKAAELTIRPLTIFCGPNNTNKTWTAYAIYGLAQRLSQWAEVWHPGSVKSVADTISVKDVVDATTANQGLLARIDDEVTRFRELAVRSRPDTRFVHEVDRSDLTRRVPHPVAIGIGAAGLSQLIGAPVADVGGASVLLEIGSRRFASPLSQRVSLMFRKGELSLFSAKFDNLSANFDLGRFDYNRLAEDYVRPAIEILVFGILGRTTAFPAERKLIHLVAREVEFDEFSSLALPLRTYATFIKKDLRRNESREGRDGILTAFERLLGGRIEVVGDGAERTLVFRFAEDRILPLSAASSLVRSMAGLYRYLATVAKTGDFVIIDEPEMNAHPEAQLMIAELLGILVRQGINVLVTTHTPYIVDHVNNLMEADRVPAGKKEAVRESFNFGTDGFVPTKDVAVYVFGEDGRVTDAVDRRRRIIDWSTFGRASDRVTNLYSEVLEAARQE